jgi:regulatory protein
LNPEEPASARSLRSRAIAALSRRDHSRQELFRKLAAIAESPDQLNEVLDTLEREGLLSDQRYAESVARVRGARFGATRVRHELEQKGVAPSLIQATTESLRESEADRLRQVWVKKFGNPPADLTEAAKQTRFLLQRGFSSDLIRRLLRDLRSG